MRPAVLFDLDGTLLDTAPDLSNALNYVLTQHSRKTYDVSVLRNRAYGGSASLLKYAFNISEDSPLFTEVQTTFHQHYAEHLTDQTTFFPGMAALLDKLDHATIPWGIVTNKPTHLSAPLLEHFNLLERTTTLVCGDSLATKKPAPDTILLACEHMAQDPKQVFYVGDSKVDMQAANRAGCVAVLAKYGYIPSNAKLADWPIDHQIDAPLDLLALIEID